MWTPSAPVKPSSPGSAATSALAIACSRSAGSSFPASVAEEGVAHDGGGASADALRNGTTRNGAGGAETRNDGKTFRGYGKSGAVTFRFDPAKRPQGQDIARILTFAGHHDERASQSYTVLLAFAGDPEKFVRLATVSAPCEGGASEVRLTTKEGGAPGTDSGTGTAPGITQGTTPGTRPGTTVSGVLDNGSGCRASGVAAVRFEFADGPLGFNVYREICIVAETAEN